MSELMLRQTVDAFLHGYVFTAFCKAWKTNLIDAEVTTELLPSDVAAELLEVSLTWDAAHAHEPDAFLDHTEVFLLLCWSWFVLEGAAT